MSIKNIEDSFGRVEWSRAARKKLDEIHILQTRLNDQIEISSQKITDTTDDAEKQAGMIVAARRRVEEIELILAAKLEAIRPYIVDDVRENIKLMEKKHAGTMPEIEKIKSRISKLQSEISALQAEEGRCFTQRSFQMMTINGMKKNLEDFMAQQPDEAKSEKPLCLVQSVDLRPDTAAAETRLRAQIEADREHYRKAFGKDPADIVIDGELGPRKRNAVIATTPEIRPVVSEQLLAAPHAILAKLPPDELRRELRSW